ncbi:U-box domain-containing protein 12-like [Syzygium oleosum]|uniref:U-box domain-containing protein 12-like n=1 Tax=Syzygium oleosum TaxID=219896 RepID=UPI0011D2622F|nr:U-box domain-containing protein 12-like [Syzygium oleosum]XP_030466237.1 U-box domain-containing protein 12-like [Syzygium oleosum]XP_030466238.1 U-box domain-containing protein 12-like [Syzygium oleosum]XP_030466239.1 U-box domain-containing protein 12-like [Syzygium oleosum]XP_056166824.1 U-box domain-containing protein 12-like [Syzygium oleosum]
MAAAACPHGNDIGSLLLNRASSATASAAAARPWPSFSGSALRRRLLDAFRCGGGSFSPSSRSRSKKPPPKIPPDPPRPGPDPPRPRTLATFVSKSEKLSDLLQLAEIHERQESDVETRQKVEALEKLKRVVRDLQDAEDGEGEADREEEKRRESARHVRLLAKEDPEARTTLAMLGAIPPLVGMLDSSDLDSQIASLYALLNLGIGNDMNKAAIVKAGAVHKMLKLIESPEETIDPSISEAIVANFLGLSALDSNKPIIGLSGAIPFLVNTLIDTDHKSSPQAKQDALRALYNLSIFPSNICIIIETDLVPFLMNALGDMEISGRILSILSNIVSTPEGRKAISVVKDAFPIMVDILNWTDSPGCQEKASYVLMVMSHKAYGDRQAMIEAGIVSALLELTLLGSTLSQKRASRILECLRVDKGKQISESYGGSSMSAAVSAPICGASSTALSVNGGTKESMEDEDMMSEEKKAVQQLVQQSLQSNMRRIVKRANLPQDFVPSDHLKSLTASSTSKSLPF